MAIHEGTGPTRRTMGARTGGRSERVVRDVMRATIDELARVGYGPLRVEDVAARAKVNKTTVYRRWPTKAELVRSAVLMLAGFGEPVPDTGAVRIDLLEMLRRAIAFLRRPESRAIARLVTLEAGDPDVERLARELRATSHARRSVVVERAKARGEIAEDVDAVLVLDAIFAPIMSRALRFGETVDDATLERLVDLVVTGAEHGGGAVKARRQGIGSSKWTHQLKSE